MNYYMYFGKCFHGHFQNSVFYSEIYLKFIDNSSQLGSDAKLILSNFNDTYKRDSKSSQGQAVNLFKFLNEL